jgi:hypothetical protein
MIMMLYHVWNNLLHRLWHYYSSNNSNNSNNNSDSEHKTNDKIWYDEHVHESLYSLVTLFGIIIFLGIIVLRQIHMPTLVPPIMTNVDHTSNVPAVVQTFLPLDAHHMHTNKYTASSVVRLDTERMQHNNLSQDVHVFDKSSSFGRMCYYYSVAKLVKVRRFKRLANLAKVQRASSVMERSNRRQEGGNSPYIDHYKNQVVIPVISADCTRKYNLPTASNDNIQQTLFACKKKCPVSVPSFSKVKNHCYLCFRSANIITTSNMIVMYPGLITGRPPGFALATIRQFITWQTIINNKSPIERQDGWTQQQDGDYYIVYNIMIHLVVWKKTRQRNLYSSSERGVTTFAKEFALESFSNSDGTRSQQCTDKMIVDSYGNLFPSEKLNTKLKTAIPKNDYPDLDDSPFLNKADIAKYFSMIGALHWMIALGRLDVYVATTAQAKFRMEPRQERIERVKVCGHGEELKAKDDPTPLDKKRQATVETATYGSEFMAAHIATGQIIDRCTTLRYLGVPDEGSSITFDDNKSVVSLRMLRMVVFLPELNGLELWGADIGNVDVPVEGSSIIFGDNKSVVTSLMIPHSGLNKRHNALSCHRVREAIAAKILKFFHIDGTKTPADFILRKHIGYSDAWPLLQPLLFWRGQPAVNTNKEKDAAVQVIGECQDLKRTEANKTRRSVKPFTI